MRINDFLIKLGLFKDGKGLYIPTRVHKEREYDEDMYFDYHIMNGFQIFPKIRKVDDMMMRGDRSELVKYHHKYHRVSGCGK